MSRNNSNFGLYKLNLEQVSLIVHRGGSPGGNKILASLVESHGSYLYKCLMNEDFGSLNKFLIAGMDITSRARVSLYTPHFGDYAHKFQISSLYLLMFVYAGLNDSDKSAFAFK